MEQNARQLPAQETNEVSPVETALQVAGELYRSGTAVYAEEIQRYDGEIASHKHRLAQQRARLEKEEKKLRTLETEIEVQLRMLERLDRDIHAKIDLLFSMKHTIAKESPKTYETFFRQERERLHLMSDEAETMEIELLETELNRLNLLDTVLPLRHDIEQLEQRIRLLEMEKQAFQNSALHNLPKLALTNEHKNGDTNRVIETETVE